MNIIKNLVSSNKYNIKCPYIMDAEVIVVHNTYNDASARNEIAYMIKNDNQVSYHYAIDDKEVVQGIPENRNTFNAGDGRNGRGNRKGLSIEICYSKSGGQKFIEAEKLAAQFIAFKLNEKGWGINKVQKHQDFSGKYCPHRTLDMGWQRFLGMVQVELNNLKKGDVIMNKPVNNKPLNVAPSTWATESWTWCKKEGLLDGTRPLSPITREEVASILFRLHKSGKLK